MQRTAQGTVQLNMIKTDSKTISVEVPPWHDEEEYLKRDLKFKEHGPISGHIDLVRIEDDKIRIWDFKPKAAKEKCADMQVLIYALMLSYRTKISLDEFRCGYFDQYTSYVFEPKKEFIEPLLNKNK